jgi:hypothetical protein
MLLRELFLQERETVHACSLFHEMDEFLLFDSTVFLLPNWLSGKVSASQQYGLEFAPHSGGF